LRLSESERDGPLKEVLLSTSGVVFLGCPHRATEHSTLADAIKSMAGVTFRVDSQDLVLDHLSGASSVEAELGRQAFIRMWNDYNFKVKTFQESIIPSYRFLELRAEAVSDFGTPTSSLS
jgi:protein SERAC1